MATSGYENPVGPKRSKTPLNYLKPKHESIKRAPDGSVLCTDISFFGTYVRSIILVVEIGLSAVVSIKTASTASTTTTRHHQHRILYCSDLAVDFRVAYIIVHLRTHETCRVDPTRWRAYVHENRVKEIKINTAYPTRRRRYGRVACTGGYCTRRIKKKKTENRKGIIK